MSSQLSQIFKRLFLLGLYRRTDNYELVRKLLLINSITLFAIAVLFSIGMISYFRHNFTVGLLDHAAAVLLVFCIIYLRRTGKEKLPIYVGMSIMTLLYYYMFFTGGASNTGFLWFYTYPLFALYIMGKKEGAVATLILFLPAIVYLVVIWQAPSPQYSQDFTIRFIPSILCVLLFSYLFESTRFETHLRLQNKQVELEEIINVLSKKEKELKRAQDNLEIRIEKRTEELKKTNEKLCFEIQERKELEMQLIRAQKMEALGTLAGGVAHDLNNILSGIVTYPEVLLLELPEGSELRAPLQTIKYAGERAADIVQDLLTLARRGVANKQATNINQLIKEIFQSPEYEALKTRFPKIQFEFQSARPLPNVVGSCAHIHKAIHNLMINAAESVMDKGAVIVSTRNQYVDRLNHGYDPVKKGDYVVVEVKDTGQGILSEDLNHIFEPFYTKKNMAISGTGLGLAVVWGTVKDHGGFVDVKSSVNEGSVFSLFFPATRQAINCTINQGLASIDKGEGENILVVDDVEQQRLICTAILIKLGYNVKSVASGEEAVEYLKNQEADLVVLDMIMDPGIDGYETFKRIKAFKPFQKVIITSGFAESIRVKKAQAIGAGAYIKKPFSMAAIAQAIKTELSRS
jgi:signal transduction histidine kinase